jgi:hypothetical protein
MRFAIIAAAGAGAIIFSASCALAQHAGTGATITAGDAAVSPATPNPANGASGSTNRPDLGAGIASGAVNNGTTGDTIGTGHGTSSTPAPSPGAASPAPGGRKE